MTIPLSNDSFVQSGAVHQRRSLTDGATIEQIAVERRYGRMTPAGQLISATSESLDQLVWIIQADGARTLHDAKAFDRYKPEQ